MIRKWLLCISALFVLPATAAADDIKVCEVIPASDFEAALGFKVNQTRTGTGECERFSGVPGTSAQVKAVKREGHQASGAQFLAQMKKMGFKGDVLDDTTSLWCARLTAPATMGAAQVFECRSVTAGHYFEVKAMGPLMTREKAKALVSRVAARLP